MTADDFAVFLSNRIGLNVETVTGEDGLAYLVIRGFTIPVGSLNGRTCDIAVQRLDSVPFVPPAAIHTRPALLPMNTAQPYATQKSGIGSDWQYWSRRFDLLPTPQRLWTHILTVLCDDRWPTS